MVFHITRPTGIFRIGRVAQKFRDNGPERLAEHIVQNVQATTMRHPDNDFLNPKLRAAFQHLLDRRNDGLCAVHPETLGAGVFLVQIFFEFFGLDKAFINGALAAFGKVGAVANGLDTFLNPGFLGRILNMHEFYTDGAGIGLAQKIDNFAKGRGFQTKNIINENRAIPVFIRKAIGRRVQFGVKRLVFQRQRIQLGKQMAPNTIGANQHHRAQRVERGGPHGLGINLLVAGMALGNSLD